MTVSKWSLQVTGCPLTSWIIRLIFNQSSSVSRSGASWSILGFVFLVCFVQLPEILEQRSGERNRIAIYISKVYMNLFQLSECSSLWKWRVAQIIQCVIMSSLYRTLVWEIISCQSNNFKPIGLYKYRTTNKRQWQLRLPSMCRSDHIINRHHLNNETLKLLRIPIYFLLIISVRCKQYTKTFHYMSYLILFYLLILFLLEVC